LEQAYKSTGRKPKQLQEVEFPDFVGHLWEWFAELHSGRQYTADGSALPLGFETIKAWSDLMNINTTAHEIRVIKQIDNIFIQTK
jgi:hypothetical protein